VGAVFAVSAAAYAAYALVMVTSRLRSGAARVSPEPFIPALQADGRYVGYAPVVRRILLRAALFLVPASALWALLPLIATRLLHQGAEDYGVLLGALGLGAVAGAIALRRFRALLSMNQLTILASAIYAAALVGLVLVPSPVVAVLLLLPAGSAWITVLSEVNASLQLFLPTWVRARGLSVYHPPQLPFGGNAGRC
jgi:hypothetical protein